MSTRVDKSFFEGYEKGQQKYNELKTLKIGWKRPKPEKIFKEIDLDSIYKYGYDYASMYVHPMSNDGEE